MFHVIARCRLKGYVGVGILCCLLVLASLIAMWHQTRAVADRTIRVGADNAPPYYTIQSDGSVQGLAVDILNEAAHRRGIRLQWIGVTDMSLDQALLSRRVDLWPAVGITSERQSRFHFTEPWLEARFCLVSREGAKIDTARDSVGKTISHVPYPNTIQQAVNLLPGANLVSEPSHTDVIRAVCHGKVDAAFLDSRILDSVLLHRPQDCGTIDFRPILPRLGAGSQYRYSERVR